VTDAAVYLSAHLLAVIPGLAVLWLEPVRSWRWPAKLSAAYAAGAVALAVEAVVVALFGARWNVPAMLLLPALPALWLARRARRMGGPPPPPPLPRGASLFALAASALALLHLAARLATTEATSVDLLLFWGAKAIRFAQAETIDPVLLGDVFFSHARPFYPPLLPVVDAVAVTAAGELPWNAAPWTTLIWLVAAALIVCEILARRHAGFAPLVTAFWVCALAPSLAVSYSGGNAETPLLLYISGAGAMLMAEQRADRASERWLAGLFLAGAVLAKVEGVVAGALLIAATALRDRLPASRRPLRALGPLVLPPLLAGGLWAYFVMRFGLSLESPGRGTLFEIAPGRLGDVLASYGEGLEAGTSALSWGIALFLLLLAASRDAWRRILPGVVAVVGTFLFLLVVYLHEPRDPAERISWEVPRVTQPSLSLLILAAGVAAILRGRADPTERRQV
jgi:hypothetical protein